MDITKRGTDYAQSHRQRFLRALRQPKYLGVNRRHGIGQFWKLRRDADDHWYALAGIVFGGLVAAIIYVAAVL